MARVRPLLRRTPPQICVALVDSRAQLERRGGAVEDEHRRANPVGAAGYAWREAWDDVAADDDAERVEPIQSAERSLSTAASLSRRQVIVRVRWWAGGCVHVPGTRR